MKQIIGILMMLAGAVIGLYVGVWVCFIGGIVDVIGAIRADDLIAMDVAIGTAKVLFAGVAGWLSGIMAIFPGYVLANS
jgi:hypothetical protein